MTNYTTINHEARIKLGLSWLEYGLADLIYNLANNPKSIFPGWCYASKVTLANQLGTTKKTVHIILNKLEDKGLIERNPETKHIKVTIDWFSTVVIKDSNEMLLPVTKGYSNGNKRLLRDGNKRLHNKDIDNKDITTEDEGLVKRIVQWAYNRSPNTPSISPESYKKSVLKAIEINGPDFVSNQFQNETNAISFLVNIK